MRAGWLAVWVVLVAAGCQAIPTAADFDFPDVNGVVGTDDVAANADAVDVSDVPPGTDTVDLADQIDSDDTTDAVDALDGTDEADVVDIVDVLDVDDTSDAPAVPDVPDVIDAVDVADTPDVPPVEDVVDAGDAVDAAADAVVDVLPDEVDVQQDVVPDVPVDPCAGKNCDDGNVCTTDSCDGTGACQHVDLPDWSTCGEGAVCDGKGTCSDVKIAKGMAFIPSGTFWMGCNATKDANCNPDEKPQHKVTLSPYYMDLTETTVAQYKGCVDSGVCTVPSSVQGVPYASYPGMTVHPVNFVSWAQARQYCQWNGVGFDLPTEAQWEMAARGSCEKNGSTAGNAGCAAAMRTYPWGETAPSASYTVFNVSSTAVVGSIPAGDSPYGLHDMAGNVWEWTRDWYSALYYVGAPATDPYNGVAATYQVMRGGAFNSIGAAYLRSEVRFSGGGGGDGTLGFRCSRTPDFANVCANVSCPAIACATNSCDPATGQCVATPKADGTLCDDGNACTAGDACTGGTCSGTVNCDDGNACTTDACGAGACKHVVVPDWSTCGDGSVCDGKGTCGDVKTAKGMAYIPAGTFWMGCNATKDANCNPDEKPQHKVTLSAYYMDLNETTVGQYKACVDVGGCTVPSSVQPKQFATYPGLTSSPVNFMTAAQSADYCKWRGAEYSLPTEAQWEMAARGSCEKNGSTAGDAACAAAMRTYPWGEASPSCSYAVMSKGGDGCGTGAPWAVGSKTSGDSPYGLHDMAGNVAEWTEDGYASMYYSGSSATDPFNATGPRVSRGGSLFADNAALRAGFRDYFVPSVVNLGIDDFTQRGMRCVRSYPTINLCANVTCPDLPCATQACNPATGQCVATPKADATLCDDGNACTSGDTCTAGACGGVVNCGTATVATEYQCATALKGSQYSKRDGVSGCDNTGACSSKTPIWGNWTAVGACAINQLCSNPTPTEVPVCTDVCVAGSTCCTASNDWAAQGTKCADSLLKSASKCGSASGNDTVLSSQFFPGCNGLDGTCSTDAANLSQSAYATVKVCQSYEKCLATGDSADCVLNTPCQPGTQCCTANGQFAPLGAQCDTANKQQFSCSNNLPGGSVLKRDVYFGCTGYSAGCSYSPDNYFFTPWVDAVDCLPTEICNSPDLTAAECTTQYQCVPGSICCSATGNFLAKGTKCGPPDVVKTEYMCDSAALNGSILKKEYYAGCVGTAATCSKSDGDLVWQPAVWLVKQACGPMNYCHVSGPTDFGVCNSTPP